MISLPVTICVACFGRHPELAQKFLAHLYRYTRPDSFFLRIGLNEACAATVELARGAASKHGNVWIHYEPRNIFKSPLMAKLFFLRPIQTDWVVWFDDDSFPYRGDWLPGLVLKTEMQPDRDVWGNALFTEADEAATEFIRTASWYRRKPFNRVKPSGESSEHPVLTFVEGGFWAARTQVLEALPWPDPRLMQNGDDYFFGEALRQNDYRIGEYRSGIRINQLPRRWPRNTPREYRLESPPANLCAGLLPERFCF